VSFESVDTPAARRLSQQGPRFAVVGVAATLTHLATAIFLMDVCDVGLASVANAIALVLGSTVSYLGNAFWTFGRRDRHAVRIVRFGIAYAAVFLLGSAIMFFVADIAGVPYLIPLGLVVIVTPIATFVLNRHWVFG
jgi:putative flippase GtrA